MPMLTWMPSRRAQALEPWWISLPIVASLFAFATYNRFPSSGSALIAVLVIDGSLILAGCAIAWRGRERMLASLACSAFCLMATGAGIAGMTDKFPPIASPGSKLSLVLALSGMWAATLPWMAVHVAASLQLARAALEARRR